MNDAGFVEWRAGLDADARGVIPSVADRSSPFCTDLVQTTGPSERWRAIGGQITIELVPAVDAAGSPKPRATIRLTGAVFVKPTARGSRRCSRSC